LIKRKESKKEGRKRLGGWRTTHSFYGLFELKDITWGTVGKREKRKEEGLLGGQKLE